MTYNGSFVYGLPCLCTSVCIQIGILIYLFCFLSKIKNDSYGSTSDSSRVDLWDFDVLLILILYCENL